MAFTPGGKWLATSGSEQLILWPFATKDGPMGKQPRMVAPYDKRAVAVACHPKQEIVAAGFEDGLVMLCRIDDGAEILAKGPGKGAGLGARLERRRLEARVRDRGRRGGDRGSGVSARAIETP